MLKQLEAGAALEVHMLLSAFPFNKFRSKRLPEVGQAKAEPEDGFFGNVPYHTGILCLIK